jgi:NADH:quinone reductase (non-electrogenic)
MHRVVILGGGFGGLDAARELKRAPVSVTLIDRRNFHLFQPLLYQVATGSLSPGEIASPLRTVLRRQKNTSVLLGEARDLDVERRKVILESGEIDYDTLIVSTGSGDFYFGHDEWKQFAPGLKSIESATEIRHKILYAFEAAEKESDPEKRREWLTFVMVGGGATGLELAGALGEIARELRGEFRSISAEKVDILLLEGGDRILANFPPDLSAKAEAQVTKLGVTVRKNARVMDIDANGVQVKTPGGMERINARTVIWSAGVRASAFGEILQRRAGAQLDRGGRVAVNPDLTVPGHPEIFVIGDLANSGKDGKPLPGVAQAAIQGGRYAARLIRKRLKGETLPPFHYFDRGNLAVIGRAAAVAEIGPLHVSGIFAWLIWLFIHLMNIVEFSNRVLVFVQWGFLYITWNRGARLITGSDELHQGESHQPAAEKETVTLSK